MKKVLFSVLAAACLVAAGEGIAGDDLEAGFRAPPSSARPQVWWHWMNGNVSKAGITADLEAMKAIGIGGAHIIDVACDIPEGPVRFNTPAWFDHVRWAAAEAKRLGLVLGIANCSGFSSSGGPWVTPADSMKRLVWTEKRFCGPGRFEGTLPPFAETNGFYRDVAVLALKAPTAIHLRDRRCAVSCTVGGRKVDATPLTDGKAGSGIEFGFLPRAAAAAEVCVTLDFGQMVDVSMLGLNMQSDGWSSTCSVTVEAGEDGKAWRGVLKRSLYTRLSGKVDETLRNLTLPKTTARHFRVRVAPLLGRSRCSLREIDLGCWGGIDNLPLKTFSFKSEHPDFVDLAERGYAPAGESVPLAAVTDLTDRMTADGSLDWTAPAGDWRILRFGCAAMGVKTRPATPGGAGLETDKLCAESTRRHFDAYARRLFKELGPDRDVIESMLVDSYEVGAQNWTVGLERQFRERLGYALEPYLPAFAGYVVESVETTERFLSDFRRLVADLFAANYAGEMARLCHAAGIGFSLEPHGDCTSDDMQYGQCADINIGNFWSGPPGTVNAGVEKMVASIGHVWGRRYVGSEAFTARPKGWLRTPYAIKAQGDYAYCKGVNRMIYHRYAHQPWVNPTYVPGMTMGQWGMHFERTQTWWPLAKDWVTYQTRCQYLLQEGRFVADVVLFCGEDAPNSLNGTGAVPKGYDFDGCAAAAVRAMRVEKGDIVLPSGMRYRVLALPANRRMSLEMLACIGRLVETGATVVGPKPMGCMGLSGGPDADGCLKRRADAIWRQGVRTGALAEVLKTKDIQPDFVCPQDGVSYIHRQYDCGADAYFVAWPGATGATVRCSFRQKGRVPELWNPERGEVGRAPEWAIVGGRTEVPLELGPGGAVFVVFRTAANGVQGEARRTQTVIAHRQAAVNGWDLSFPAGWGAPENVRLDSLTSWTEIPDDGVKYFSGTATYRKRIPLDRALQAGERLVIDLGEVRELAELEVNGLSYPVLWKPPFRMDVTAAAAGKNALDVKVKVTNLWPNRLIGDERLPPDREWSGSGKWLKTIPDWVKRGERSPTGRFTFTTWHHWTKDDHLLPSGLLGPVGIQWMRTVEKHDGRQTGLPSVEGVF